MLLVVAAWLSMSVAAQGDPLTPYRGQPVLAVDVEGVPEEEREELRSLIEIEPGYLLETDALETAVKRLYALGRFSDVRVYARRSSGTVALVFYVRRVRQLGSLEITGLVLADREPLLAALKLRPGDEVDSRTRERLEARAISHLQQRGFPAASAEARVVSAAGVVPIELELVVHEDEPLRVTAIRFTGRRAVSAAVLSQYVRTRGLDVLSRPQLENDRAALERAYRERGFLQARVAPARITPTAEGADVEFVIDAGPRIAVDFSGNTVFSKDDLHAMLGPPDVPLTETGVRALAERVAWEYRRLGRFGTRVEVKGFRERGRDVVRWVLVIHEASPAEVVELRFEGTRAFSSELLAEQVRAVLRRELGVYGVLQPLSPSQRCLAWRDNGGAPPAAAECPPPETPARDRWVPELYQQALDEIAGIYKNLGFLSVSVGPATPTFDGRRVHVVVPVIEGRQTFVRTLGFAGNEAFSSGELLTTVYEATANRAVEAPVQPGSPFSTTLVEDARIAMVRRYRELGYLYARVFASVHLDEARQWADVSFRFEEGPQVRVARVLVRGNRYTREGVIKSRITLQPGDLYRLSQALSDQRAIAQLGVFSSVRVKLIDEERPEEQKDLVAEVVERDRQPIEIAPGISTADGPRLAAQYSHINMFGLAVTGTVSAKINRQVFFSLYGEFEETLRERYDDFDLLEQLERELRAGLRSPRITTLPLEPSLRLDVVHERTNAISFSLDSATLIFGVDLFPSERVTLAIEPQISATELVCPSSDTDCVGDVRLTRPDRPRLARGSRRTFKLGPTLIYDGRDNPFNPTEGIYANARVFWATGDLRDNALAMPQPIRFLNVEGTASVYVPLAHLTLALSARGGYIHDLEDGVPIDERFFLGGRDTLRGYVERTVIPDDACVVYSEVTGGDLTLPPRPDCASVVYRTFEAPPVSPGGRTFALLKTELRVPMGERFSLGLFLDAGNLWFETPRLTDLGLRLGTGAGLRYMTPVGALALDFGVNPNRRVSSAEPRSQVHFSVGVF